MDRVEARRLHDAKEPRVMRIFMEIRRILAAVKIGVVELRMSNENTGLLFGSFGWRICVNRLQCYVACKLRTFMYMRVFLFSFYLFTIALLYCVNTDFYSNSTIKS